ncbi:MAG: hypothetical protein EHM71_08740 [Zetaproteobacteria bacterium]|nr:MAG: hypothetical protein EHM71_08740 [Zetaproteobacteria bacterium]
MRSENSPRGDASSASGAGEQEQGQSAAARVWAQYRGMIFERLAAVETAATTMREASLTQEVRQEGVLEAHRLAGSLGMLGLQEGTRLAREIEHLLKEEPPASPDAPHRVAELAAALRVELEKGPA